MSLYGNIATSIVGDDRDEMLQVWDDDAEFDLWLKRLDAKHKANRKPGSKPGTTKVPISNEEYLKKFAKVYGGEGAS